MHEGHCCAGGAGGGQHWLGPLVQDSIVQEHLGAKGVVVSCRWDHMPINVLLLSMLFQLTY